MFRNTFPMRDNKLQRNLIIVSIRDVTFGVRWPSSGANFPLKSIEIYTAFERLALSRVWEFPNCLHIVKEGRKLAATATRVYSAWIERQESCQFLAAVLPKTTHTS